MIDYANNPDYLNSFLNYSTTILNKSPNSIKEYNYDLNMFLKYIKIHFKLTNEHDFSRIEIKDISLDIIKKIKLEDIHSFISYLAIEQKSKPATRTIYLNNACIHALNDYLAVKPKEGIKHDKLNSEKALFLSERKERISRRTVQHIVYTKLLSAGLDPSKYSTHKLRHTAATLMYQYGEVDIRALQVLLGHESIATTEIYTHVDNEQVRNAIEKNPLSNM